MPNRRPPESAEKKTARIFWSDPEKDLIVECAIDLRVKHPDLSGLELLRMAMIVLPKDRRREINARQQARWFEPAMAAEVAKREKLAAEAEGSTGWQRRTLEFAGLNAALLERVADKSERVFEVLAVLAEETRRMAARQELWMERLEAIVATNTAMLQELKAQTALALRAFPAGPVQGPPPIGGAGTHGQVATAHANGGGERTAIAGQIGVVG